MENTFLTDDYAKKYSNHWASQSSEIFQGILEHEIKEKVAADSLAEINENIEWLVLNRENIIYSRLDSGIIIESMDKVNRTLNIADGQEDIKSIHSLKNLILTKISVTFPYDSLLSLSGDFGAYDLFKQFELSVCPYCGMNIIAAIDNIHTHPEGSGLAVSGLNKFRSPFDHIIPQSKHPQLAISINNLLPSCTDCNSGVKRARDFPLDTHAVPYESKYFDHITFRRKLDQVSQTPYLSPESQKPKIQNTIEFFILQIRYHSNKKQYMGRYSKIKNNIDRIISTYPENGETLIKLIREEVAREELGEKNGNKQFPFHLCLCSALETHLKDEHMSNVKISSVMPLIMSIIRFNEIVIRTD